MITDILEILTNKVYLTLMLLSINFIFQIRAFKVPIDYDTANHIYFGFLKYHRIPFLSSYKLGVKYIMPRLFFFLMPIIKNKPHLFRLINLLASSILITFFVFLNDIISEKEVVFYLIFTLLINSLWVDYAKSAPEFIEVIFIAILMILPQYLSPILAWAIQLLIIIFAAGLFKMTFVLYVVAAIFSSKINQESLILTGVGSLIVLVVTYFLFKAKSSDISTYSKSRSFISMKNVKFLLINPIFVLCLGVMFYYNIINSVLEYQIFLFITLIIFIIQRNYTTYFFYPLVVINFLILFLTNQANIYSESTLYYILIYVFVHNFFGIIILSPKYSNIWMRIVYILDLSWARYLYRREEQIKWLKNNIKTETPVYLWGSHVYLLLESGLKHIPNTYYNHNHLFLWSDIEDKVKYAVELLKERQPKYIIESIPIGENIFPFEEFFKDTYSLEVEIFNMKVYRKIN